MMNGEKRFKLKDPVVGFVEKRLDLYVFWCSFQIGPLPNKDWRLKNS
jgi:hypothetical protein